MLCSWALHNQTHSIERLLCHVKYSFCLSLSSDNWQVETVACGFQVLTFLHGIGGGNVVTLHCVSPIPTQSVETDQKIFSSTSWSFVTWHQAELRGQVERTSVLGMTQVRSPSLSCCFIVAGRLRLVSRTCLHHRFSLTLPYHLTTRLISLFELRLIFGNSENWRYWALKVVDQSNISVNYFYLSWKRLWCDFHVT